MKKLITILMLVSYAWGPCFGFGAEIDRSPYPTPSSGLLLLYGLLMGAGCRFWGWQGFLAGLAISCLIEAIRGIYFFGKNHGWWSSAALFIYKNFILR